MANPPGNQPEPNHGFNGAHWNNGNLIPETSASILKHNPGISVDWTLEEQAKLEEGLAELPVNLEPIIRYAKIAMFLPNKTVRDVAMRCRWMTKKENNKRRKEERGLARSTNRRERFDPAGTPTLFAAQPNPFLYQTPIIPMGNDDGPSARDYGGLTGELLVQNEQALEQISKNMDSFQMEENIPLLTQTRDNLLKLLDRLNDGQGKVRRLLPLPAINHQLYNLILPPPSHPPPSHPPLSHPPLSHPPPSHPPPSHPPPSHPPPSHPLPSHPLPSHPLPSHPPPSHPPPSYPPPSYPLPSHPPPSHPVQ